MPQSSIASVSITGNNIFDNQNPVGHRFGRAYVTFGNEQTVSLTHADIPSVPLLEMLLREGASGLAPMESIEFSKDPAGPLCATFYSGDGPCNDISIVASRGSQDLKYLFALAQFSDWCRSTTGTDQVPLPAEDASMRLIVKIETVDLRSGNSPCSPATTEPVSRIDQVRAEIEHKLNALHLQQDLLNGCESMESVEFVSDASILLDAASKFADNYGSDDALLEISALRRQYTMLCEKIVRVVQDLRPTH